MVLPFQFTDTEARLEDKSTDLSDVAGHLKVELLRIGVAETLETIDGLVRVPALAAGSIGDGFAPEAAGILGAGISTRHRWFGSEPYAAAPRREASVDLVVRGSPVTVSNRALVRLRIADGRDRVIDDFFVDVYGVGEGLTPEDAMHRVGTTVAEVTRLSEPARIAEWLPIALDAVDRSAGELLRSVAIQPLPLWSMRPSTPIWTEANLAELDPLFRSVLDRRQEGAKGSFYTVLAPWVWYRLSSELRLAMRNDKWSDDRRSKWIVRFGEPYDLPANPDDLDQHILEQLDAMPMGPGLSPDLERLSVDIERRVRARLTDDPLSRKLLFLEVLEDRPADSDVWTGLGLASYQLGCWGGYALFRRWGGFRLLVLLRLGVFPRAEDPWTFRLSPGSVPARYLSDAPERIREATEGVQLPGRAIGWDGHWRVAEQGYPHDLEVRAAWLRYRVASDPGGIDLDVQKILGGYEDHLRLFDFPPDPARFADPDAPTHAEIQGLLAEYETGVRELSYLARGLVTAYQTHVLAGIAAMRGDHEEALTRLESVHRSGLLPLADLEHDPALMDLRHHPRFQAMIEDRYRLLEAERRLWDRFQNTPPSAAVLQEVGETCLKSVEAFGGLIEQPSR